MVALFKIIRDNHFFSIKFHTTFWTVNEVNEALFNRCFTEFAKHNSTTFSAVAKWRRVVLCFRLFYC